MQHCACTHATRAFVVTSCQVGKQIQQTRMRICLSQPSSNIYSEQARTVLGLSQVVYERPVTVLLQSHDRSGQIYERSFCLKNVISAT
jgi:hypothetical protein